MLCYFCKMKTFSAFVFFVLSLFLCSCKSNSSKKPETQNNDSINFFQVNQFIQSEINEVNHTPYYIYKIEIIDGKQDSSAISNVEFNQLSSTFLTHDINEKKLKPYYKESTFEDESTKSFTINYSTLNKELELQSVDIILGEDAKTLKRILARKFINYNDSSAIEQLSWKPGERFMINRSVQLPDNKEIQRQIIVVWNEKNK